MTELIIQQDWNELIRSVNHIYSCKHVDSKVVVKRKYKYKKYKKLLINTVS